MLSIIDQFLKTRRVQANILIYQRNDFDVEHFLNTSIEVNSITDLAFAYFWLFPTEKNLTLVIRKTEPYPEIILISSFIKPEYVMEKIKTYLLSGYTYNFRIRNVEI